MNCPRCTTELRPVRYEDADIATCDSCGGEFVSAAAIRHIVATRAVDCTEALTPEERARLGRRTPVFGVPDSERHQHADCPCCGHRMTVGNYLGDSGVFVDRCGSCGGVWLDHCELEHVQSLMERWQDDAPAQIRAIAGTLEAERLRAASGTNASFQGSRFSFVNALLNRFLDAG